MNNELEEIEKQIKELEERRKNIKKEEEKRINEEKEVRAEEVRKAYKYYADLRDKYYNDFALSESQLEFQNLLKLFF